MSLADTLIPHRAALRNCRARLQRLLKLHAYYEHIARHPQHHVNPELDMIVHDLGAVLYGDIHRDGRF